MISLIDFKTLPTSGLFGYASEVPFFQGRPQLVLEPGLNILFGPNGSGKSTVLNILAQSLCAAQGGVSAVTEAVVHDTIDMWGRVPRSTKSRGMQDRVGVTVHHDGQPVLFTDPRRTVGLSGGTFDDDFFEEGLQEVLSGRQKSHGQQTATRSNVPLGVLMGKLKFPAEIRRIVKKSQVNEVWGRALDLIEARLTARIPVGQPTVLLDEPEANFSLVWQQRLWALLSRPEVAARYQVLVASHSPFALGHAHAHYIDFAPGYREDAERALRGHFTARGQDPL